MNEYKGGKHLKRILAVAVIALLLGTGTHLYLMYEAARSLEIRFERMDDIDHLGNGRYRISFALGFHNPRDVDIEAHELDYDVYMEDEFVGQGTARDLVIPPGRSSREFSLDFDARDAPGLVDILLKDTAVLTVEGEAKVPVKAFGALEWASAEVPFREEREVKVRGV